MNLELQITNWLKEDDVRMKALHIAEQMRLNDWCIGAGFIRNLVWDKLHNYSYPTPLNDIDLIYFDKNKTTKEADQLIEDELKSISTLPWSVKNQARMHTRNHDEPYTSTSHAMSYWVEMETAIGATLSHNGDLILVAPFGLEMLFRNSITLNPNRPKIDDFRHRITDKGWLKRWPNLRVMESK